ncbi:MAG: alpha/beta fold hydrolase [Actinomycetota bacterium]
MKRFLVATVSVGLVAMGLTVAPAQAAPPDATPVPRLLGFTPILKYVSCPAKEALPARTRCATLTVPLDWQKPKDGRTIKIALRITRSAQRDGALTFNPGGPGEPAIGIGPAVYSLLPAAVRDRFDFVVWDPRGVGLSGPALTDCPAAEGLAAPLVGPVDWRDFWDSQFAAFAKANSECLAANPNAAPYLGTWQVIRDLEAMRIALGYKQWNYWGMSYGTRIGHAYARTFPSSLRTLIMDGSLMAGETAFRFGTTFPSGVSVTKQVYASINGKAQAHKMNAIFDYLDRKVITIKGTQINRWGLAQELRGLLGQQAQYPTIRKIVDALYRLVKAKTGAQKARAAHAVRNARALLPRTNDSTTTIRLINCADLPDRPTAEQLAAASGAVARDYGTVFVVWMANASMCAGLPDDLSPPSPHGTDPIDLTTPPVFVLSTGDSATPWAWGRSMANTFTGSRTISYTSTQHVSYLFAPSACVNDTVTRYLLTLQRPSGDIACAFTPSPPLE